MPKKTSKQTARRFLRILKLREHPLYKENPIELLGRIATGEDITPVVNKEVVNIDYLSVNTLNGAVTFNDEWMALGSTVFLRKDAGSVFIHLVKDGWPSANSETGEYFAFCEIRVNVTDGFLPIVSNTEKYGMKLIDLPNGIYALQMRLYKSTSGALAVIRVCLRESMNVPCVLVEA